MDGLVEGLGVGFGESVGFMEGLRDLDGCEEPFFVGELDGDGLGNGESVGE